MFLQFWHFIVFTLFLTLMPEILHANMIDSVRIFAMQLQGRLLPTTDWNGADFQTVGRELDQAKAWVTALREVREDDLASALESLIQYVGR